MAVDFRERVQELLAQADVQLDGERPWDVQVHDERLFQRVLAQGSLGLGEAYMDQWWDCERLDEFFHRVLRAQLSEKVRTWRNAVAVLKSKLINLQSPARAYEVGERHYDIGNDLYENMLDKRLIYTCGYWRESDNLDDAQEAKLELVARKLKLEPGMRVLDIGCGWGGTAKFLADRYGCEVVGVTVSQQQVDYGNELCTGLPVQIRLQDYREVDETFDCVLSLGMIEHVGYKNYRSFMEVASRCLKEEGLLLLHTIGGNRSVTSFDPWMERYIFTNSMLPSARQLCSAAEGLFVLEDWHNFGADYDKTLMAWFRNFTSNWETLSGRYSERFYRMWTYYLCSCAGSFRARKNQLWQIVFSPRGVPGGYRSIR